MDSNDSYYDYMFQERFLDDSDAGNLAFIIWIDKDFPRDGTRQEICVYLDSKVAGTDVYYEIMTAFRQSWREYEDWRGSPEVADG